MRLARDGQRLRQETPAEKANRLRPPPVIPRRKLEAGAGTVKRAEFEQLKTIIKEAFPDRFE